MQKVISRLHQIVADTDGEQHPAPRQAQPHTLHTTHSEDMNTPQIIHIVSEPDRSNLPKSNDVTTVTEKSIALRQTLTEIDALQCATTLSERKNVLDTLNHVFTLSPPFDFSERLVCVLLNTLSSDPRDTELAELILEYLCKLVSLSDACASHILTPITDLSNVPKSAGASTFQTRLAAAASGTLSNRTSADEKRVGLSTVLNCLQDSSPYIRSAAIALVKIVQESVSSDAFINSVLSCQEGLRKLFELTFEQHEHIRDTALQVFVRLTECDAQVKQFVAFEDGLNRFFSIIKSEVHSENIEASADASSSDTIDNVTVILDCLQIIANLITDDSLTQSVLRQTPYLETHLPRFLQLYTEPNAKTANSESLRPVIEKTLYILQVLLTAAEDSKPNPNNITDTHKNEELTIIQRELAQMQNLMSSLADVACELPSPNDNSPSLSIQIQAITLLTQIVRDHPETPLAIMQISTWHTQHSLCGRLLQFDLQIVCDPLQRAVSTFIQTLLVNEAVRIMLFQQTHSLTKEIKDRAPLRMLLDGTLTSAHAVLELSPLEMSLVAQEETLYGNLYVFWKCMRKLMYLLQDAHCKQLALRIPKDYHSDVSRAIFGACFPSRLIQLLQVEVEQTDRVSAGRTSTKIYNDLDSGRSILHGEDEFTTVPLPVVDEVDRSNSRTPSDTETTILKSRSRSVYVIQVMILQLLYQWTTECPEAVWEIVSNASNVTTLIKVMTRTVADSKNKEIQSLAAYVLGNCVLFYGVPPEPVAVPKESILQCVSQQLGLERYNDILFQLPQSKAFILSSERSDIIGQKEIAEHSEVYDWLESDNQNERKGKVSLRNEFLFPIYDKSVTRMMVAQGKRIQNAFFNVLCQSSTDGTQDVTLSTIQAYRDLIRVQDREISHLRENLGTLSGIYPHETSNISEEQDGTGSIYSSEDQSHSSEKRGTVSDHHSYEFSKLRKEVNELNAQNSHLTEQVRSLKQCIDTNKQERRELLVALSSTYIHFRESQRLLREIGGSDAVISAIQKARKSGAIPFIS